MILHIPHSSSRIENLVTLTRELENLYHLTDFQTDKIFCSGKGEPIIFKWSRFVCDVERLIDDPLEKEGQGIIYRKDFFGNDITRNLRDEHTLVLYNEHHKNLNMMVAKSLTLLPRCVVVDCHSFSSDMNIDICIGTDDFHTPKDLFCLVYEYFNRHSLGVKCRVRKNLPFSGTFIPTNYKDDKNVSGIMIEINKNMYAYSNGKLDYVKMLISGVLDIIYDYEFLYSGQLR